MHVEFEFIDDYSADFLQVGKHDEDELRLTGEHNHHNISIELDALSCLRYFPHVTNLILKPGCICKEDLRYLNNINIRRLKLDYYSDTMDEYAVDLSVFPRLESVFSRTQFNYRNSNKCEGLTSLVVQEWYTNDFQNLSNSKLLKLKILSGKLTSLNGINRLYRLKHLSISNQRLLTSITDVQNCPDLECLEIESCNKLALEEIPTLPCLKNLTVIGRQTIESCAFFTRFPKLETLILGIKIMDGDISSLYDLKQCSILTNHRHYSRGQGGGSLVSFRSDKALSRERKNPPFQRQGTREPSPCPCVGYDLNSFLADFDHIWMGG